MVLAANLGFPRIGARRELKKATEAYWKGEIDAKMLRDVGRDLRARHWQMQKDAGIEVIPSNDFSYYDQVLDMAVTLGAVPGRFRKPPAQNVQAGRAPSHRTQSLYAMMGEASSTAPAAGIEIDLDDYFAMARGTDDAVAMEMTKWFDTNYHYIVPEFHQGQTFRLSSPKAVDEFKEAKALGIHTRPVLIGPVTFLALGKMKEPGADPLSLLPSLLPVYAELLSALRAAGASWVQIDEPILGLDLTDAQRQALQDTYVALAEQGLNIQIATYFGGLRDNLSLACTLPVQGLHADLVRGAGELDTLLAELPRDRVLSLGIVDGRNIWRADLSALLPIVERAIAVRGSHLIHVAPSCSLLHVPVDLDSEAKLDVDLKSWMAFARQKLEEVVLLVAAARGGRSAANGRFDASDDAKRVRAASPRVHSAKVAARLAQITPSDLQRVSPFSRRRHAQHKHLSLPAFPTTTIGSFPQTPAVRKTRAAHRRGGLSDATYQSFLKEETRQAICLQEQLGLDVLVHGEFERNDMVEYFGEQLAGFAFTQHGWVQSYGTRYVKPPVIYGDVARPKPMTTKWGAFAQSLTDRPVKGMLTGPVTILQWSFVREDQPRSATCKQIALAIRDEVLDLEKEGIRIIQIDEPALREGLPLRKQDRQSYLKWAVDSFRLASSGVKDETQIHTHMCYSEFNDIIEAISALDADVISIETARSQMELLEAFVVYRYPNEIGPGVYDIHSPRCPSVDEMIDLLERATKKLDPSQIWVNPDCGLKTRSWEEVRPALKNMVAAAEAMRASIVELTKVATYAD